jgi:hypothetical protein
MALYVARLHEAAALQLLDGLATVRPTTTAHPPRRHKFITTTTTTTRPNPHHPTTAALPALACWLAQHNPHTQEMRQIKRVLSVYWRTLEGVFRTYCSRDGDPFSVTWMAFTAMVTDCQVPLMCVSSVTSEHGTTCVCLCV